MHPGVTSRVVFDEAIDSAHLMAILLGFWTFEPFYRTASEAPRNVMPTVTNTAKGPAIAPRVLLDEDLWFSAADSSIAEEAAAKSMAATAGTVLGAKPFPESARRLAELASKDNAQVGAMVEVLEQDPALSAKLLRVVNSAGFGLRQRCTSIRHAVTLVGSKHLHQMATTAAVLDLFDSESGPAVTVLEHSAVVGAFCRYLGTHQGLPSEDLFTAGVLHDIGKIMLLETFGERYHALFDQRLDHPETLFAIERAEYGFDHGVLAAHVLKAWNIPEPIPKIVAWHHEPARAYESSTQNASMVQILRMADLLAHAMFEGAERTVLTSVAQHEAASYLDISEAQLGAMWDELSSLYQRTLRQKRGHAETDDAESTTRLKSHPPKQKAADVPKQFPCAKCGSPGFGTSCAACHGYVCDKHPIGEQGWCSVCADEYPAFVKNSGFPINALRGGIGATAIVLLSSVASWVSVGPSGLGRGVVTGIVVAAFAAGAVFVARRTHLRAEFVRTRPDRAPG